MKRIKSVTVTKLFGYEGNDYSVELDSTSPINFVYAFNGVGKTTLFRLIYAALRKQLTLLDSISFETLEIIFDDDEKLVVKKTINKPFDEITIGEFQKDETEKYYFPIIYEWHENDGNMSVGKFYFNDKNNHNSKIFNNAENKHLPFFVDEKTKKQVKIEQFYKGYYVDDLFESNSVIDSKFAEFLSINILYANKDYDRLITEQIIRNRNDNGNHILSIFENYNSLDMLSLPIKDVKEELLKREYENATMDDITNDERVIRPNYDNEIKYVSLKLPDKTQILQEKLKNFFTKSYSALYFKEIREQQIPLYEKIINSNSELTNKTIHINRKTGEIEIKFAKNKELLPIEKLSSGEKNLLLLYFTLIFSTADNSILLIDEPETSLHPDWLISFVDNVNLIAENKNTQYIIATHSPAITYGHSMLMQEMKRS